MTHIQMKIFRNLRAFQSLYNQYIASDMNRILKEREKFINYLSQKLIKLKRIEKDQKIVRKNWRVNLNENLYKMQTLTLKGKSLITKIIQKDKLDKEDLKQIISILSKLSTENLISLLGNDFKNHTKNYVKWGWDFYRNVKMDILRDFFLKDRFQLILFKEFVLNKKLDPPPDLPELVNKWFTDSLKAIMLNYDFLRNHASFRRMSSFFGLTKYYLYDIRYKKTIISHEYLDQMKNTLSKKVKSLKSTNNIDTLEAQDIIFGIIEIYRQKYDPKITASTQIDKNLKQNYFSQITSIEQAFFLGLMFADGWVTIQHSKNRESYKMGLALKDEDRETVEQFAIAIGLSKNSVRTRHVIDSKTGRRYKMAYLYIGVGSTLVQRTMGNDLIKLGMVYKINKRTGRWYKVPKLPIFYKKNGDINRNLMLAFLLGYYNGDGTLKSKKYPIIYSSNREFLEAINKVFSLSVVRKTEREIIDFERNTINQKVLYSLYISQAVFKEMMSLQLNSMKRKSIDAENIILTKPIMTKNRIWLMDILPKDLLERIFNTHSPSTIANLIGIDHNTMIKFIDFVYKIPRKDKAYYIKLASERNRQTESSELNRLYNHFSNVLINIGNENPFK
ncbi:MAG: hypothetical protein KGD65_06840 [Candidatus Lokiarchaeota archaeon]|nr:hypothetical protein [Candidatus Lokiarchaeota archaeon]